MVLGYVNVDHLRMRKFKYFSLPLYCSSYALDRRWLAVGATLARRKPTAKVVIGGRWLAPAANGDMEKYTLWDRYGGRAERGIKDDFRRGIVTMVLCPSLW